MTSFFTPIPESQAVVYCRGVYRQVPAYERAGMVYARYGAGFIRLNSDRSTSHQNVRRAELDTPMGSTTEAPGGHVKYAAAPEAQMGVAAE